MSDPDLESKAIALAMNDTLTNPAQWNDDDYTTEEDREHYRALSAMKVTP